MLEKMKLNQLLNKKKRAADYHHYYNCLAKSLRNWKNYVEPYENNQSVKE